MKKTLELGADVALVCVLMFAFILPIIISFNLIPKLYTTPSPTSQVAINSNQDKNVLGVSTDNNLSNFDFVQELNDSKFENILSVNKVGSATVIDMVIYPSGIVSRPSYVFLGNIINNVDRAAYKVSLLKNTDVSSNLSLNLKLNDTTFNSNEVLVTLDKDQKSELGLVYSSDININFNQKVKVLIENAN